MVFCKLATINDFNIPSMKLHYWDQYVCVLFYGNLSCVNYLICITWNEFAFKYYYYYYKTNVVHMDTISLFLKD